MSEAGPLLDREFRSMLSGPEQRKTFWRILEMAGTFGQTFVAGDAMATSFQEGSRAVGLKLVSEAQRIAPDLYIQMLAEELSRRRAQQMEEETEEE